MRQNWTMIKKRIFIWVLSNLNKYVKLLFHHYSVPVLKNMKLNGVSYMGTITPVEARGMIYDGALGLDQKIWPASRSGSTEEE